MQVHQFLESSAKLYPHKQAVWHKDDWYTYSEINERADRVACFLIQHGIRKHDRVAISLENSPDYIAIYFGILKAGATVVGLGTDIYPESFEYLLNDSGSKVLFAGFKNVQKILKAATPLPGLESIVVEEDNRIPADFAFGGEFVPLSSVYNREYGFTPCVRTIDMDLAELCYTSGSTGKPKGVMLSHLNLVSNMRSIVRYLELTGDDRMMAILPFFYIYGKSLLLTHFLKGGSIVIDNRFVFPNKVLETMVKTEVTGFAGVPSTFSILLKRSLIREYKFPTLRYVTQAGGAMHPDLQKEVYEVIKPAQLYIMYGATEAAPRLTYLDPKYFYEKLGSIGKPVDNVEVFIADEEGVQLAPGKTGEIVARGSNIMAGYWKDPEATHEVLKNGLYFTGDVGTIDEQGFLYVLGRKKEIVKVKGYRVSTREIEEALMKNDMIVEASVVAVRDDILGEAIKAFVVVNKPASISEEEIKNFLSKRVASYMIPSYIEFCDKLPRNEAGKVLKSELG